MRYLLDTNHAAARVTLKHALRQRVLLTSSGRYDAACNACLLQFKTSLARLVIEREGESSARVASRSLRIVQVCWIDWCHV